MTVFQQTFISDCEGPISRNDNAYELAEHFIPEGGAFFKLLSRFDDVLAYILQRANYSAGYTLKLLVPFLKAYGVTNENVISFSRKNISLIRDARSSLGQIQRNLHSYIVSTSYSSYIDALCTVLDFPKEHTFSTHLDLDGFFLAAEEIRMLQTLRAEMLDCPPVEIPEGAKDFEDLPLGSRRTVERLDAIFWGELPRTSAKEMLEGVHPVGSVEKARAVANIVEDLCIPWSGVFYVGDSITDADVLGKVRDSGGIAVSFNGNGYAVEKAEISVLSDSLLPVAKLVEVFSKGGRDRVLELARRRSIASLSTAHTISVIAPDNLEEISNASIAFRSIVRGETLASLG